MGLFSTKTVDKHAARKIALSRTINPLAYSLNKPLRSVLCTFKISILPKVLGRAEVYVFTLLHIVFFILKQQGYPLFYIGGNLPGATTSLDLWGIPLRFSAISIPSGLMSLLLVFFNGQCYARYTAMYGFCTAMGGAVQEITQLSAVHAAASPTLRWDATRYLLASVMVVYMKVTDIAIAKPASIDPDDWERLMFSEEEWLDGKGSFADRRVKSGRDVGMPPVLEPHEVEQLKQCTGSESQVLQMWALDAMWQAYERQGAQQHFFQIEHVVLAARRNTAAIPNMLNNPVPFPYYHLLVALMWTNYMLYAVTFLEMDSWLTPVAMFLIVAVTTGVRELSSALANPFGSDEVDFNHTNFIHALRKTATFLAHPAVNAKWQLPNSAAAAMLASAQAQEQSAMQMQYYDAGIAYHHNYGGGGGGGGGYADVPVASQQDVTMHLHPYDPHAAEDALVRAFAQQQQQAQAQQQEYERLQQQDEAQRQELEEARMHVQMLEQRHAAELAEAAAEQQANQLAAQQQAGYPVDAHEAADLDATLAAQHAQIAQLEQMLAQHLMLAPAVQPQSVTVPTGAEPSIGEGERHAEGEAGAANPANPPPLSQYRAASGNPAMLEALSGQPQPPEAPPPAAAQPSAKKVLFPASVVVAPPRGGRLPTNMRGGVDCGTAHAGTAPRSAKQAAPQEMPAVTEQAAEVPMVTKPEAAPTRSNPLPPPKGPTTAPADPPPPQPKPAKPAKPASALPFQVGGGQVRPATAGATPTTAPIGGKLKPLPAYTLEAGEGGKACWRAAPPFPSSSTQSP